MAEATMLKQRAVQVLSGSSVYPLAKFIYRHAFRREYFRTRAYMMSFYGALVEPGALVFDVGANRGDFSDAFLRLGSSVVAVEPHPFCAKELLALYGKNKRFSLEVCALGPSSGEMELYLGENGMDNVSTLSEEFREKAMHMPDLAHARLTKHITVKVATLDALIAKHGPPGFCKIDVEGFELQVLQGLTAALPLVQFEYQPWMIESALECVACLQRRGDYRFNLTASPSRSDHVALQPDWLTAEQMSHYLKDKIGGSELSGDIYARSTDAAVRGGRRTQ